MTTTEHLNLHIPDHSDDLYASLTYLQTSLRVLDKLGEPLSTNFDTGSYMVKHVTDTRSLITGDKLDWANTISIGAKLSSFATSIELKADTKLKSVVEAGIRTYINPKQGYSVLSDSGASVTNINQYGFNFTDSDMTTAEIYLGLLSAGNDKIYDTEDDLIGIALFDNNQSKVLITNKHGLVLKSPNGTRFKLNISDDGTLSTEKVII
ncbi:hypothetical protein ThvES_00008190 [Thiovulum sp. ES]|nr:hypothetical protein ThvES_00008190 [Thiovulum sp. ES]